MKLQTIKTPRMNEFNRSGPWIGVILPKSGSGRPFVEAGSLAWEETQRDKNETCDQIKVLGISNFIRLLKRRRNKKLDWKVHISGSATSLNALSVVFNLSRTSERFFAIRSVSLQKIISHLSPNFFLPRKQKKSITSKFNFVHLRVFAARNSEEQKKISVFAFEPLFSVTLKLLQSWFKWPHYSKTSHSWLIPKKGPWRVFLFGHYHVNNAYLEIRTGSKSPFLKRNRFIFFAQGRNYLPISSFKVLFDQKLMCRDKRASAEKRPRSCPK